MALKLTRKGIVLVIVLLAITFFSITAFTAWFLLTDGGNVGFIESIACGLDPDSCGGGGGGSGGSNQVQCTDGGTSNGCKTFICPLGCGGDGNSTSCNGGEPGAYTRTSDSCEGKSLPDNTCGQIDWMKDGRYCQVYEVDCDCDIDKRSCGGECDKDSHCDDGLSCIEDPDNDDYGVCGNPNCSWDEQKDNNCQCPTVQSDPPKCDFMRANIEGNPGSAVSGMQTLTVPSKTTRIVFNAGGSDPDGQVTLESFVAAAGQTNPNNGDLSCSWNEGDSNYSFYCRGLKAYAPVASKEGSPIGFTKTFNELKTIVDDIDSGYVGNLDDLGFYVTTNVKQGGNVCSSNISMNNGGGILYNGGQWNETCQGNCGVYIKLEEAAKVCNDTCSSSSECPSGLTCSGGRCRNPDCTSQTDCQCPNPQCNDFCSSSSDCPNNLTCSNGRCRNPDCTDQSSCQCPPAECNSTCGSDEDCPSDLTCTSGRCRNLECTGEADCICPEPVCNDTCDNDNDCPGTLTCDSSSGRCRNPVCPTSSDCECPGVVECNDTCDPNDDQCPSGTSCDASTNRCRNPQCPDQTNCTCIPPRCGDGECNQASEKCENNISCIDGSTVECRSNCKYCGDGIVNGNEQCDPNSGANDGCSDDCLLPYCGDGKLDEGEECEPALTPGCTDDCKLPLPPEWEIIKEGTPECVEGKEIYADVFYKITIKNIGEGAGDVDKVIDTLDQKVQDDWLYTNTVEPNATWINNILTWELGVNEQTLQPDEDREFVYQIQVPQSDFGSLTNIAELIPVSGGSVQVTNIENITCEPGEAPKTGVLDSALAKIGLGLVLISISGIYFYFEGTDGLLMRFIYKDEKVQKNRENFEKDFEDKEK